MEYELSGAPVEASNVPGSPLLTERLRDKNPSIMHRLGDRALLLHQATTMGGIPHECASLADILPWCEGKVASQQIAPTISEIIEQGPRGAIAYTSPFGCELRYIGEQDALKQLSDYVLKIEKKLTGDLKSSYSESRLFDCFDKVTFIDTRAYNKAAAGIATKWKYLLDKDTALCVVVGEIAKHYGGLLDDGPRKIKSDEFLLERILWHFSDKELGKYAGKLLLDPDMLPKYTSRDKARLIFLDDWMISGEQMTAAAGGVLLEHELSHLAEIQLITASPKVLDKGFDIVTDYDASFHVPVSAYFQAHSVPKSAWGVVISGSHSSVDYDFALAIDFMGAMCRNHNPRPAVSRILSYQEQVPGLRRQGLYKTALLRSLSDKANPR